MMLKGLTVHYLIHRYLSRWKGETVLWHAAAGGVGLIACQWLKALGVTVIGTAGSDEKTALAKAHGATHVVNYSREDFVERVKTITGGAKVPVVSTRWARPPGKARSTACGRAARWSRSATPPVPCRP